METDTTVTPADNPDIATDGNGQDQFDAGKPEDKKLVDGATKAQHQKYKLGEEEYDEPTLKKLIADAKRAKEIEKGGRSKFEEAAQIRQQFRQIGEIINQNPHAGLVEMAKLFGLPENVIDQLYEQRSRLQAQWEKMSEDQKARYIAEQKLRQLETEKQTEEARKQEEKQTTEVKEKQDAFEKKLAADTIPAMQEAGLHPTHLKLKLVAATLGAIADRDGPESEPDVREAVAYVAEAYQQDLDDSVKALDPAAFAARYPELTEKLRQYQVSRATGRPQGSQPVKPAAPREPPNNGKRESWSDFSKRMRMLQKGQRP